MSNTIFEVQKRLLKEDKVIIKQKTIQEVAKLMKENHIPITTEDLYWNCIIDSIQSLVEFDRQVNTK